MAGWDGLRVDLRRLVEESPGAFVVGPSPYSERRDGRRFPIALAAWATEIAGELKAKYGEVVDLQVGALTFPTRELRMSEVARHLPGTSAEAAGLEAEVVSPLSVRTGRFVHGDVLVRNRADHERVLVTNGNLQSVVIDSAGNVAGRFVGPQNARRVGFPIEPHGSRPVPVLIGTASVVPDLGYAVPPGDRSLVVSLQTSEGYMVSRPLGITITP